MTVKMHLMLNSRMMIDGNGDMMVVTSLLEVSNLMVLKVLSQFLWLDFDHFPLTNSCYQLFLSITSFLIISFARIHL